VTDTHDNSEMNGLSGFVTGAYDEEETEEQEVTDEFYDETDPTSTAPDQPADTNLAGDIFTPAVIEEMLGDWGVEQTSPPPARTTGYPSWSECYLCQQ
jgi:hypothetical protein